MGRKCRRRWKNGNSKNIDAAALNRIASTDVIGVMAMNMDPAGLKEFLKTIGMDGMANMFLSKQNLTLDELLEASKGQFVMALSDLKMKDTVTTVSYDGSTPVTMPTTKSDMSFIFAANVNKKATFEKLQSMATAEAPAGSFVSQLTNDWFVAGNKTEAVNGFATGANTKHAFTEKLSGHPFGFYLDIQRLLKTNFTKDPFAQSMLAESAALWKDMVMVSNEYKNGASTSEFTVNFVDGKTNSLKQLNQYFEKLNAAKKANKVAMEHDINNMTTDSTAPLTQAPPAEAAPKN